MEHQEYVKSAIQLLKQLIATPSVSRSEDKAADIMAAYISQCRLECRREANNVWTVDPLYDAARPTLLLNAHLDTVKPVPSWTRDPFTPALEDGRIYGLGSNDCGGGLVSLLQVFRILAPLQQRKFNLVYLASAEEEVSGKDGIERVLPLLPKTDVAIVGEPTGMQPAIAEKGLMVLDLVAHGKSGHAARSEGENAIYKALDDLNWLRNYQFPEVSELLGATQMNVTVIKAGSQHNVIPDRCEMTVDVRTNECYDNEEVYNFICKNLKSEVKARSFRLHSSHIDPTHPLVKRCRELRLRPFGSPTLSDQALMPFPSFKMGPGDSARSHTANEYIEVSEIARAIELYVKLLDGMEF